MIHSLFARRRAPWVAAALITGLLGSACDRPAPSGASAPPDFDGTARNVILMIGDGMGPQALGLLLSYIEAAGKDPARYTELSNAGTLGLTTTHASNTIVVDSAASATAMATGTRTTNGSIGVDPDGKPLPTVLEKAKARGMATGLVTTTRVTDATPAAFAAHVPSRKMEAEIAVQMLRDAEPDVLLGGGGRFWIPAGTRAGEALPFDDAAGARETSKREDALNLVDEARERGYRVVAQAADLEKAARDPGARRILGLFTASEIPYAIDRGGEPEAPPSLPAMTAAALACLERAPKGFFLMVEGARIDHAGHQNDAAAMLGELREFDAALGVAFDYARRRRDTLVVVVADHDTGGFGFTYRLEAPDGAPKAGGGEGFDFAPFSVLEQLSRQQMSFERIVREARGDPVRLADLVRKATGFSLAAEDATDVLSDVTHATGLVRLLAVGAKDQAQARTVLLARALTESTNVVWASAAHTSTPIVVAAYGPGMARLGGIYPNTHIAEVIGDR